MSIYDTIVTFREGIGLIAGGAMLGGGLMTTIIKRHLAKIDRIEDTLNKIIPIIPLIEFIERNLNEKVDSITQNIDLFQKRVEKNIEKLEDKMERLIEKE